jgi:outer membrane protein TolC
MKTLIRFAVLFLSVNAHAADFKEIWSLVKEKHPELKSVQEDRRAAEDSSSRSLRHWLPQAYLIGRAYNTNDPLYSFMGNLGQRSITFADFNADILNHPNNINFAQFTLGLNLPIYEGGMSSANSRMQGYLLESRDFYKSATQISVFSSLVSSYANVLNSENTLQSLDTLKLRVKSVLSRYTLGAKTNPVGYSGLLGLKSIVNRIDAAINQVSAEGDSRADEINQRTGTVSIKIETNKQEVGKFLKETLPDDIISIGEESYSMLSAESGVGMEESKVSMERARFLPQIGLFSESNMTTGARNTASSYVGGVYLKWTLFNPKEFGVVSESIHHQASAEAKLENDRVVESISRHELMLSLEVVEKNLEILQSSTQLMSEQVDTSVQLFQSGAINALQLVEVFNRRADLILQINELNQNHIKVRSQLAKISRLKGISL